MNSRKYGKFHSLRTSCVPPRYRHLILELRWAARGAIALKDLPSLLKKTARELENLTKARKPK